MELEIEFEIEAPWGNFKGKGMLGILDQTWHQLQYYKKQQEPKVSQLLKNDIEGYEAILKSKSEKNANTFMKYKHDAIRSGKAYADNLAIVKLIKKNKEWNE